MGFGSRLVAAAAALLAAGAAPAAAESWFSGDWYLKVGGAVLHAPRYQGAPGGAFKFEPLISVGKHGRSAKFTSRNDNISIAFIDTGSFRAGAAGKLIFNRGGAVAGMSPIRFGGELGGFAEVYPTDFLRLRGEVRHGIRSHGGVVADLSADAFVDVTDTIQISGGPRASWATQRYFDAYFGVDAGEAAASGLAVYSPGSGLRAVGIGGAVTWKTTDKLTTSAFVEYERLMGPAAASSLVRQRGSRNQLTVGASAVYRFDFSLR